MPISSKIARQMEEASWIRKMFEEGVRLAGQVGAGNIHDFTLGNPDLEPPPEFVESLRDLVVRPRTGMHRYMPNAGYPEVREAVARWVREESGVEIGGKHVILAVGAGGGLNVVLKALLDPGDEVVVFAPYFPEYAFYIDNHGGVLRVVETDGRFRIDFDRLEAAIGPRTKAVFVNSPNNPTGVVYDAAVLARLGGLLRDRSRKLGRAIYLVSDDPYKKILFDGTQYSHVFRHYESSIAVYSHSKDLGLAGERIGHVAVHPAADSAEALVAGMTFAIRVLGFVNAPGLMQLAIRDVLRACIDPSVYQRRRDVLHGALTELGFECVKPRGAFYLFPRSLEPDDRKFARVCLGKNILIVPGVGFGRSGHFRISLTSSDRAIEASLPAWREVAKTYATV